jgi:hypothetical protein
MLNVDELSETGSPVALAVEKAAEVTRRPYHRDQWDQDLSADPREDLEASEEVVSVVGLMLVGDEAGSEVVSKIVEGMVVAAAAVVVVEVVLATKVVEDFPEEEEALQEIADLTGMVPLLTRLLDPVVDLADLLEASQVIGAAAASAEEVTGALAPLNATELQHQLVGMIHVVVVAHMMTETVDIVAAAKATATATARSAEVAATWSQSDPEKAAEMAAETGPEMVAAIATETGMEATVADHEKTTHARDSTRATAMKRTLENFEDIRCSEASIGLSCGGFLDLQSFPLSPGVSGFSRRKVLPKKVVLRVSLYNSTDGLKVSQDYGNELLSGIRLQQNYQHRSLEVMSTSFRSNLLLVLVWR